VLSKRSIISLLLLVTGISMTKEAVITPTTANVVLVVVDVAVDRVTVVPV